MASASSLSFFKNSKYIQLISILALSVIAFFPVFSNGFTNLDDLEQVTENPDITSLSFQHLKIIFSSFYVGMYQPFTTLCFAILFKLFSLKAIAYHSFSIVLHAINILLVFRLVSRLSKNQVIVFGVTLLFAVNPMQAEAVAWVSATSTLLYSLFFLLAANSYFVYLENKHSMKHYYFSLLFFLLALFSKSAAVTLPLLLILFDYFRYSKITKKDILNKIPFFLLAILFGIITIIGRKEAGHIFEVSKYYTIFDRVLLLFSSISFYISSIFVPFKMSAFHPYPDKTGSLLPFLFYVMPLLLIAIIIFLVKVKKGKKEIRFGFLFFLLSISVMIELIPVGLQIVKERYTYISGIGIYFAAFSYLFTVLEKKEVAKKIVMYTMIGLSLFFVFISYHRTGVWKSSFTLWNDVIEKYPKVSSAYINRGNAYTVKENYEKAILDYNKAIKLEPNAADAYMNRAVARSKKNDLNGALEDYNKAIAIGPADDKMYSERAVLKLGLMDAEGALEDFKKAIEINPSNEKYFNQRGIIYGMAGLFDEALADFSNAITLDPDFADAYSNRGLAKMNLMQNEAAIKDFSVAIEKNPSEARTYFLRGSAYEQNENYDEACADFKKADAMGFDAAAEEIAKVCK